MHNYASRKKSSHSLGQQMLNEINLNSTSSCFKTSDPKIPAAAGARRA